MGKTRLDLQQDLENFWGNRNVYFQPPESKEIKYDAIVYSFDNSFVAKADNSVYRYMNRYKVSMITKSHREDLVEKFLKRFRYSSFITTFVSENLYHYIIYLYY